MRNSENTRKRYVFYTKLMFIDVSLPRQIFTFKHNEAVH